MWLRCPVRRATPPLLGPPAFLAGRLLPQGASVGRAHCQQRRCAAVASMTCSRGSKLLSAKYPAKFAVPGVAAGHYPSIKDWETHLTTIFPEVRLKRYMEMRGADGGPCITALSAFWVGLLYDRCWAPL